MSIAALDVETAAQAFLTPARHAETQPNTPWYTVYGPSGALAVWSEGEGPAVLLVHGWEGSHHDLDAFVQPLVASGHKVVTLDLPAHGQSEGRQASIPDMAAGLLALDRELGPFAHIVAHSIGCAVVAEAMLQGLDARRVVMIAPPSRYASFARGYAAQAGIDPEAMLGALRARGIDIDHIDLPKAAPQLGARGLVVHSRDDRVVPVASGRAVARAWPNAELLELDGLGHGRILRDDGVVWAAVSFLAR